MKTKKRIKEIYKENIAIKEGLSQDKALAAIEKLVDLAVGALGAGGKIILFGNGGSAADAQHIAAELVGRFTQERKALAAIALTCNSSNVTSIGNDYGFEQIFTRQLEALGKPEDLAIGISTSGSSVNVVSAILKAKKMGMMTVALTGIKSGPLLKAADLSIAVPSTNTARIQEAHITIGHIICELVEQAICD